MLFAGSSCSAYCWVGVGRLFGRVKIPWIRLAFDDNKVNIAHKAGGFHCSRTVRAEMVDVVAVSMVGLPSHTRGKTMANHQEPRVK